MTKRTNHPTWDRNSLRGRIIGLAKLADKLSDSPHLTATEAITLSRIAVDLSSLADDMKGKGG